MVEPRASTSRAATGGGGPREVRLRPNGIEVGDRLVPLVSGSIHYWRLEPSVWPRALDEMAALGLPIVCTYVPWAVHEVAPGRFDFGERDPRLDLRRFLDLCADRGLFVILRPGPHINAELTGFGFPERVLADPRCQARSAQGAPVLVPAPPRAFPAPSFASPSFLAETRGWVEAFGEVAAPALAPRGGPVVLLQADNEAGQFFRTGAFDQDYAPGAVEAWRAWLRRRYDDDPARLADAHGTAVTDFEAVPAPTGVSGGDKRSLVPGLDWMAFKESMITGFVGEVARMLRAAGLEGVPLTHNFAMTEGVSPVDLPSMETTVDLVGVDLYHPRSQLGLVRESVLALSGTSRLPFAPELGVGGPWYLPALTIDDGRVLLSAVLAYGLRAVNLYMIVDRDRWYGSPVGPRGDRREALARFYREVLSGLSRSGFHRSRRPAGAVIVDDRVYGRLMAVTSPWDPLPAGLLRMLGLSADGIAGEEAFGYAAPPAIAAAGAREVLARALDLARVAWVSTNDAVDRERLDGWGLVCVPSAGLLSEPAQALLVAAARGGATVLLGPDLPEEAEGGRPCGTLRAALEGAGQTAETPIVHRRYPCGAGEVVLVPGLDVAEPAALAALFEVLDPERALPRDPHVGTPDTVDALWHEGPDARRFVGLVNRGTTPVEVGDDLLDLDLVDLATGERFGPGRRVTVAAESARLLEVVTW